MAVASNLLLSIPGNSGKLEAVKTIRQHAHGKLFLANGRTAFLLLNPFPEAKTAASHYLCFALVLAGPEDHILPALIKDDWGNERRGRDVYAWLEDEGYRFPRSEIFGFNVDGTETQCFVRAIDMVAHFPCYVYRVPHAPVAEGILLDAILLPDESVTQPQKAQRPLSLSRPLRHAAVAWWHVHPAMTTFDMA